MLTDREGKAHLPKICGIDPKKMKTKTVNTYLKKFQKDINYVTRPFSSADISISSLEISNFCYIKK